MPCYAAAPMSEGTYDTLWDVAWNEAASHGPGFRSRYELLLQLMAKHGLAGRLLEVGAGRGHFLERLHARFPWVELSAHEMAPAAVEHLKTFDFLDAVHAGPIDPGEVGHAGFHAIVCSEVLEHIPDHHAALDAMVAILRPGGRLYLTVPLNNDYWTQVDDAVGHQRRYERDQLAGMCRARGLRIDEDLNLGFPLYNAYYKVLGRKAPADAVKSGRGPIGRIAARVLTRLFVAEGRHHTKFGIRGFVVARKHLPPDSRGR
jgi:trans-aconitate methyltransferase